MDIFHFLAEFGGYLLEAVPIPFLMYAPFSDSQLRINRKKLLLFLEIIIFTGTLICAICTNLENHRITGTVHAVTWLTISVVYARAIRGKVRGRLLNYLITIQYILYTCTAAAITAKLLQKELLFFILSVLYAGFVTPSVCYLLRNTGVCRLKEENQRRLRLFTATSGGLVVLFAVTLAVQTEIALLVAGRKCHILLTVLTGCVMLIEILAYVFFFSCLCVQEEKDSLCIQLAAAAVQMKRDASEISEEKKRRHNLRHHLRLIASLLENRQYGEMENYLRKYLKEWELTAYRPVTSNSMFNAIMSYYINQANKSGICVKVNAEIQEQVPFEYIDMTVLLGNALENAVEACILSKETPPIIYIDMYQVKHQFLIQIENSCKERGEMLKVQMNNLTKSKRNSGYGIGSIKRIAEKYGGNIEYQKNKNRFVIRITLYIPNCDINSMQNSGGG